MKSQWFPNLEGGMLRKINGLLFLDIELWMQSLKCMYNLPFRSNIGLCILYNT